MKYNGKYYQGGRIFKSVDETNAFLSSNPGYGVIGEIKTDTIYIDKQLKIYAAKNTDTGRRI